MPHQCVRCGSFYDDGDAAILKGCKCGGKLFFYIKKSKLEKLKKETETISKLSEKEKNQIEDDAFDLVGVDKEKGDPVILDLESIRVLQPGKFEIDLVSLINRRPIVFKLEEGKYIIDIESSLPHD